MPLKVVWYAEKIAGTLTFATEGSYATKPLWEVAVK
jgi:hypothetical protein